METVTPIPEGYGHPTPYLFCSDATAMIDFLAAVFGAEETVRLAMPDGRRILHAEVQIAGRVLMLGSAIAEHDTHSPAELGGSPVALHLYVADVDAAMERAVAHGANVTMPVAEMFWGDRMGKFADPEGFQWSVATRLRLVPQADVEAHFAAMFAAGG